MLSNLKIMKVEWHSIQFPGFRAWIEGEGNPLKEIKVGGKRICLVRLETGIMAINAKCPHAGGPLAGGFLDDDERVICPWHRFAFNPQTGQSDSGGYFVDCYKVEVTQQGIRIAVKKKRWWER